MDPDDLVSDQHVNHLDRIEALVHPAPNRARTTGRDHGRYRRWMSGGSARKPRCSSC